MADDDKLASLILKLVSFWKKTGPSLHLASRRPCRQLLGKGGRVDFVSADSVIVGLGQSSCEAFRAPSE